MKKLILLFCLLVNSALLFGQSDMQVRSNMNVNNYQIRNYRIHNVTNSQETTLLGSLTTNQKGFTIYNTDTNAFKIWNGSAFLPYLSNSLGNGLIWVGNASGIATAVTMSGEATISNAGAITLSTSGVTGKTLAGYTVGANTAINSSDNILGAFGKLQGQINGLTSFNTNNAIPRGNGSGLVASSITDNSTTTSIGSNFNVTNSSGNTTIAGTLAVTGNTNTSTIINSGTTTTNTLQVNASASIASMSVGSVTTNVIDLAASGTINTLRFKVQNMPSSYANGIEGISENVSSPIPTLHDRIPTTLAVHNAITGIAPIGSWVENGLSVIGGRVRLGGTLLTGNTDLIPVSGSAIRIRNVANNSNLYSFGTSAFTIGNGTNLVNFNLTGTTHNITASVLNLTASSSANITATTSIFGGSNTFLVENLAVPTNNGFVRTDASGLFSSSPLADSEVTSRLLTGLTTGTNSQITASQSILQAFQDLQAQLNSAPQVILQSGALYPIVPIIAGKPRVYKGTNYPQPTLIAGLRDIDEVVITVPNAVTNLAFSAITNTAATATWNIPQIRNPDSTFTSASNINYFIQYKRNVDAPWINFGEVATTTIQLTGLTANTLYDFRVFPFYNYDLLKKRGAVTTGQFTTTNVANKQSLISSYSPTYFNYTPNAVTPPNTTAIPLRNLGTFATGSISTPTTPQDFSVIFGVNAVGNINDIVVQIDNATANAQEVTLRVGATTNTSLALWIYNNSNTLVWNQDVATGVFDGTYKQVELRKVGSTFEIWVATGNNNASLIWSNSSFGNFLCDVNRVWLRSGTFGDNFPSMGTNAYVSHFVGTIPTRSQIDAIFSATY